MAKRYRLPLFTTRIGLPTGSKEAASDGWFYPADVAEEEALVAAGCEVDDLDNPTDQSPTLSPNAWRKLSAGAIQRVSINGGTSGGSYTLSFRNAAGTVVSDPVEIVAAGDTDVTPVYMDDAVEILVALTGTATVRII